MLAAAGRYARAFAEVVIERRLDPDQITRELDDMADLLQSNPELRVIFQNPAVDSRQKLALLDAIIGRTGGSKQLRNFMAVLIDHRRASQVGEIARLFKHELN